MREALHATRQLAIGQLRFRVDECDLITKLIGSLAEYAGQIQRHSRSPSAQSAALCKQAPKSPHAHRQRPTLEKSPRRRKCKTQRRSQIINLVRLRMPIPSEVLCCDVEATN